MGRALVSRSQWLDGKHPRDRAVTHNATTSASCLLDGVLVRFGCLSLLVLPSAILVVFDG